MLRDAAARERQCRTPDTFTLNMALIGTPYDRILAHVCRGCRNVVACANKLAVKKLENWVMWVTI